MTNLRKKGASGAAAAFITRTRAIKKLQLSLPEFRRLCILKGVYPREPNSRKKASGNNNANNTFYYTKDIQFLLHEPIVQKMRQHKVFLKKLQKAIGKRQESIVRTLEENEPVYTLDHVVKERYPTFMDAIRDLDDCLCHIFLFATLPVSDKIEAKHVEESRRLAAEFQNYIVAAQCLKKTFLSIKGIYYQAEIRGQTVTWLVPYQFSQQLPTDVDYRVMLTFLEFYQSMLGFVNYKLYTDINLKYPPPLDAHMEENGAGILASYIVQKKDEELLLPPIPSNSDDVPAPDAEDKKRQKALKREAMQRVKSLQKKLTSMEGGIDETVAAEEHSSMELDNAVVEAEQEATERPALFSKLVVFLSREVPRYSLEFVLRAFGATVCYPETSGPGSPFAEQASEITHQIVDRPSVNMIPGRVYVQPQWVYDSINRAELVRETEYAVGKLLPPHLSPFVTYQEGDYVPDEEVQSGDEDVEAKVEAAQEQEETLRQRELEAEAAGVPCSAFQQEAPAANTPSLSAEEKKRKSEKAEERRRLREEQEKRDMAKMVMSNKQRRILESIDKGKAKKAAEAEKLRQKKRALVASEAGSKGKRAKTQ